MYTYNVEWVLNWWLIKRGPEEVRFKLENAHLLKDFVSHKELLGWSRNVSIAMLYSHTSESCLLHLNGD